MKKSGKIGSQQVSSHINRNSEKFEETYIMVEHLNSSLCFFNSTNGHKPKTTAHICFPVIDDLHNDYKCHIL